MSHDMVKLRLRFREGAAEVAGEGLWASPVAATDGGGTYSLLNNSYFVPLTVGDVVRAEVDGQGLLQICDVVLSAPVLMSTFALNPRLSKDEACAMGDRWRDHGANWSEGSGELLVTVWEPGVETEQVRRALAADETAGRGWLLAVHAPDERAASEQNLVDFEVDRVSRPLESHTSYWAADDPYWRERGWDTPEFLAWVQSLASDDPDVARYLETGQYEHVLEVIAFITGDDPRGW